MPGITSSTRPASWRKRISHGDSAARSDSRTPCLGVSVRVNSSRAEMEVAGKTNLAFYQPREDHTITACNLVFTGETGRPKPRQSAHATSLSASITKRDIDCATNQLRATNGSGNGAAAKKHWFQNRRDRRFPFTALSCRGWTQQSIPATHQHQMTIIVCAGFNNAILIKYDNIVRQ